MNHTIGRIQCLELAYSLAFWFTPSVVDSRRRSSSGGSTGISSGSATSSTSSSTSTSTAPGSSRSADSSSSGLEETRRLEPLSLSTSFSSSASFSERLDGWCDMEEAEGIGAMLSIDSDLAKAGTVVQHNCGRAHPFPLLLLCIKLMLKFLLQLLIPPFDFLPLALQRPMVVLGRRSSLRRILIRHVAARVVWLDQLRNHPIGWAGEEAKLLAGWAARQRAAAIRFEANPGVAFALRRILRTGR
uniref:Uncharacterized protein n=1 Tax=Anopheles melas TaxID=34690 RepID=A0A182TW05_9DIPT